MNKKEFLQQLKSGLSEYPNEEIIKSTGYYSEMIDDRIEDGMTEEEAVESVGSVESIVKQIKYEMPITTLVKSKVKEKTKDKRTSVWAVVLLIIGSPLWIGILALVLGLFIMVYALIWVADLLLWVAAALLGVGVLCGIAGFAVSLAKAAVGSSFIYLGGACMCAGIGIFLFFAMLAVSKGIIRGTKWFFLKLKQMIIGKEKKEA